MKKKIGLILYALAVCLVGFASIAQEPYADQAFMNSLASGLETRWEQVEEKKAKTEEKQEVAQDSEEWIPEYCTYVSIELDAVSKYQDGRFEDDKLKKQVDSYIACLTEQKEALQLAGDDPQKYRPIWYQAYQEQSKLLEVFIKDYGLTISEEYDEELNALLDYVEKTRKLEARQREVDALLSPVQFQLAEINGTWKTYYAVVKNTTSVDFGDLAIRVRLLGTDGVVDIAKDSAYDFKRGEVATFAFSTDKELSIIQVQANDWTDWDMFEGVYADAAFIQSLASGLEASWKLWDEQVKQGIDLAITSDSYIQTSTAQIEAELDQISEYQDRAFLDSVLKDKMLSYIDCLHRLEEALQYPKVDQQKYYDIWYDAYHKRSRLIESFVKDYGLEVAEEYQEELDDEVECGKLSSELIKQQNEEELTAFLSSIQFEVVGSDGKWNTYVAVAKNTTDVELRKIEVEVQLMSINGTVVDTFYDEVSGVKSGDLVTFAFSTDKVVRKFKTQVSGIVG